MNQQSFLDFCLMKFGQGNHMTMLMLSLSKSSDFKVFSARTRAQSRRFQISPGEQGWRSGEIARLPPMCPGFDSRTRRHMWVQFVVGSLPCSERFFSGFSDFLLSSKPTFPNSNSIWITVKPFIMSLWLGWSRKHSLCLILNLHLHFTRSVFEKLHFRDGLVWTVAGATVEVK